jgi:hypothetical protein
MAFKFSSKLADATKGSGGAIRKKEATHRMAEAGFPTLPFPFFSLSIFALSLIWDFFLKDLLPVFIDKRGAK